MKCSACIGVCSAFLVAACALAQLPPAPPGVQVTTQYGIEFVTIADPGNAAYPGNQFGLNAGRGGVPYEYRLARTEFTTGQWLEFANTFTTQSDQIDRLFQSQSTFTAVRQDIFYNGPGHRYIAEVNVPDATDVPVSMSWRLFALYCNWLNNDKPASWAAIQQGAYDASTFGENGSVFTDQLAHSPGARFWIPTLDEWLKGVHYDPNRFGPGQGGWWDQPGGSNDGLVPGPPGVGQTSAGWDDLSVTTLPVASYSDEMTPWGLFDASGGQAEWTEEPANPFINLPGYTHRIVDGSMATPGNDLRQFDDAGFFQMDGPYHSAAGLRIASSIPHPSPLLVFSVIGFIGGIRRRARP